MRRFSLELPENWLGISNQHDSSYDYNGRSIYVGIKKHPAANLRERLPDLSRRGSARRSAPLFRKSHTNESLSFVGELRIGYKPKWLIALMLGKSISSLQYLMLAIFLVCS
jgi:hypothetical protein